MSRRNFATVDAVLIVICVMIFAGGVFAQTGVAGIALTAPPPPASNAGDEVVKRRRLSLGWIDFLVIAASILTFTAGRGRRAWTQLTQTSLVSPQCGRGPDGKWIIKQPFQPSR